MGYDCSTLGGRAGVGGFGADGAHLGVRELVGSGFGVDDLVGHCSHGPLNELAVSGAWLLSALPPIAG